MKKILLILTLFPCLCGLGQIPIYQSGNQKSKQNVINYDSLTNISFIYSKLPYGNKRYDYLRGLIGQNIIYNPVFSTHSSSYMTKLCWEGVDHDKASELVGKEFRIIDVVSDDILGVTVDIPVFILSCVKTGEHFRYMPDGCGMEPFLSLGYFEWMVKTYKGNDWWYKNIYPSEWKPCLVDSETGRLISSDKYTLLKCTDVQLKLPQNGGYSLLDKGGVVLIFNDSIGNRSYINMGFDNAGEDTYSGWRGKPQIGISHMLLSLDQREAEINEEIQIAKRVDAENDAKKAKYIKRFGPDKGKMVYLGIVEIGMTEEMCKEALGEPNNINSSQTGYGIFEQWIYSNRYVYFKNGKIVSIDKFE